jgi:hypothetical protein
VRMLNLIDEHSRECLMIRLVVFQLQNPHFCNTSSYERFGSVAFLGRNRSEELNETKAVEVRTSGTIVRGFASACLTTKQWHGGTQNNPSGRRPTRNCL